MCLAIPAKVLSIEQMSAVVDMGGVRREVSLMLTPETAVGDYVLLHCGYAIQRLDEDEALETLRIMQDSGLLEESR
ncbi:MAG: HypC/HybG/HupF family hydrogenase formation chaperone [Deltaproteobacteria bacterium]|nr:HypC/HybG/HupF family hydrogenase formation chaperone [Deltaproteobacteria bacterium]